MEATTGGAPLIWRSNSASTSARSGAPARISLPATSAPLPCPAHPCVQGCALFQKLRFHSDRSLLGIYLIPRSSDGNHSKTRQKAKGKRVDDRKLYLNLLPFAFILHLHYCYSYSTMGAQLERGGEQARRLRRTCKIAGGRKESFILHIKFSVLVCCDRLKAKSNIASPH